MGSPSFSITMKNGNAPVMEIGCSHHAAATTTTTTGAAHPLAVQAPPTHYNHRTIPHAPPPPPQNGKKHTKCHCIVLAIFAIFFAGLITAVRVIPPLVYPPKFRLDSVSLSSFNVSSSAQQQQQAVVTANWNMGFYFKLNGIVFWNQPMASVFYKEANKLWYNMPISPSYRYNDVESLMVSNTIFPWSVSVSEGVAKAIEMDRSSLGVVNFTIVIDATLTSNWLSPRHQKLVVTCADVQIGFSLHNSTAGTMLGKSRNCKVYCGY